MFVFIRVYVRLQFLILSSFISVRMNKVGRYKSKQCIACQNRNQIIYT